MTDQKTPQQELEYFIDKYGLAKTIRMIVEIGNAKAEYLACVGILPIDGKIWLECSDTLDATADWLESLGVD